MYNKYNIVVLSFFFLILLFPFLGIFSKINYNIEEIKIFLKNSYTQRIIFFSFYQAFLSAFISCVLAIPFALALNRHKDHKLTQYIISICGFSFVIPSILVVFSVIKIFGFNGILNKYFSIFKNDFGNKAFNTLRRVLPDRVFFDHLQAYLADKIPLYGQKFSHKEINCLLSRLPYIGPLEKQQRKAGPPINALGQYELNNYLANDILVKTDRASMLNSLELRSPFLDYDLIDFAFNELPDHLKANASERKIILKKI